MKEIEGYNFKSIEKKWQDFWAKNETFKFDPNDKTREKFYALSMFLYPSGEMHTGHLRNFSIGDVNARYKRLRGFNVLHPTGADAFGLPAENAAIKNKVHPSDWTYKNLNRIMESMLACGLSFDTSRTFATCDPEYYGFQQRLFIELYKKGLVYQKESFVNWDPVDKTVLANEQVVDGRGWRSGALVEKKKLNQWFFKITDYAEELVNGIKNDLAGWPDKVKLMQENWIGKSEGASVDFKIVGRDDKITVYTTRPDTLFGASFVGISIDHPLAEKLAKYDSNIKKFIEECNQSPINEETLETAEKKGINTGIFVEHPFDKNWKLPVYIANFILMDYGTGAIFACPAHDQRDYEFAKKYNLPIKVVVSPDGKDFELKNEAFTEEGIAINSQFLNGLKTKEAKKKAINFIEEKGIGTRKINYRLRDWGISRQRYWGCPIPMVHCEHCGIVPEKIENLPIKLPKDVVFDGKGNPLENHPTWKHTKCPICGRDAIRETDTMDTFVDSSWYFMRFVDLDKKNPINSELCNKILPIDQYVGGIEHANMHLIYCRFFTKVMRDLGYLDKSINEPAKRLFNQGMVCHKAYRNKKKEWCYPWNVKEENGKYFDKNANEELICEGIIKMSKSKCNVVDIKDILERYGADSARMFVLSDTPADKDFEWTEEGIGGCSKYINRLWRVVSSFINENDINKLKDIKITKVNELLVENHKAVKDITNFMENLEFNKAIARLREFTNAIEKFETKDEQDLAIKCLSAINLVKMIAPFTPHICEELNQLLKQEETLDIATWPTFEEKFTIDNEITIVIQVNSKLRGNIKVKKDCDNKTIEDLAKSQENVKKFLDGKEIKKTIVVPNKLVNFVV